MPKVLITGASGYLGSSFLSYLPKNWKAIAFDITPPKIELPSNVKFVKGDITKDISINLLHDIDVVLHLAAIKGTTQCQSDPSKTIEVNVLGTHNLLKAAKCCDVKKFVFASTYWVYDADSNLPFKEDSPAKPSELYGLSKLISEIEVASSGLNYIILRFSNIFGFGSGVESGDVVNTFIKSAFEGKPIIVQNNGAQRLDFIDVDDVCTCLLKIINKTEISNCILNVGSGQPKSIASVARMVSKIFKQKFKQNVSIKNMTTQNIPKDRWVSVESLNKKIGKLKLKPFKQSIETYIDKYHKKLRVSS